MATHERVDPYAEHVSKLYKPLPGRVSNIDNMEHDAQEINNAEDLNAVEDKTPYTEQHVSKKRKRKASSSKKKSQSKTKEDNDGGQKTERHPSDTPSTFQETSPTSTATGESTPD